MRLFVALVVPDDVARACAAIGERLPAPELKRVAPRLMHLTLAFIGHVPEARASDARAALESLAGAGSVDARLGGLGGFPNAHRPRVVWAGLAEGADAVRERAVRVREGLRAREVPFDDAPPVAHLTIARMRDAATAGERAELGQAVARLTADLPGMSFRIEEAILFESRLSPRGPAYLTVARVPLA